MPIQYFTRKNRGFRVVPLSYNHFVKQSLCQTQSQHKILESNKSNVVKKMPLEKQKPVCNIKHLKVKPLVKRKVKYLSDQAYKKPYIHIDKISQHSEQFRICSSSEHGVHTITRPQGCLHTGSNQTRPSQANGSEQDILQLDLEHTIPSCLTSRP